jgi:hypothetical protein
MPTTTQAIILLQRAIHRRFAERLWVDQPSGAANGIELS